MRRYWFDWMDRDQLCLCAQLRDTRGGGRSSVGISCSLPEQAVVDEAVRDGIW
jgi:hypothetical protein